MMMKSEALAYWYLRLNGCLTVPNFYLHPPRKGGALTEADIVAVRFAGRTGLMTRTPTMLFFPGAIERSSW